MSPKHPQEEARLASLHSHSILDTPLQEEFDDITRLAAYICQTPIALISLVDKERQWFKSELGLGVKETSRDVSFCSHAILQHGLFLVQDTHLDRRFVDNALVTDDPHLRFYAGAILESADGFPLGTLCVLDRVPRELNEEQLQCLMRLSRQVMKLIELQQAGRSIRTLNAQLQRTTTEAHHRIKNSLQLMSVLIETQMVAEGETLSPDVLHRLSNHLRGIGSIHDLLTEQSKSYSSQGTVSSYAVLNKLITILQTILNGQSLTVEVVDVALSLQQASALTILVSELVSNAVKHGGNGNIEIVFGAIEGGARLEISDSGSGFPADFDPAQAAHTGLELIETISRVDLRGNVAYLNRSLPPGGRVVVTFPLEEEKRDSE